MPTVPDQMKFTPYADLNAVLSELVAAVRGALGETFLGARLQGSFAVGDFDRDSDVDFIIVVARPLTDEQVPALQGVHARIFECVGLTGSIGSEWRPLTAGRRVASSTAIETRARNRPRPPSRICWSVARLLLK